MRFPAHQEAVLRLGNDRTETLRDHDQLGGNRVRDLREHLLGNVPLMELHDLNLGIIPMAIA